MAGRAPESDRPANNLPAALTSFIGREAEKVELKGLLAAARLLTLVGAGGAGKTRLALAVAAEVLDEFPDGVWLVEFAPLFDAMLVPRTVAAALGVPEQPGRPILATLTDYLRTRRLLLILDNCEHLIAASAELAEALLRTCPDVRILATSREALGIAGETAWRVPSLSVPDTRQPTPVDRLREYEAVQLFEVRAASSRRGFRIAADNAAAVALICRRLDGIPLAIELAAARMKVLAVEQLAAKLDDRFRLLTGGSRTALPRQQTLRAAMDWSYDLLPEPERVLLRRLSVFAGGWTLEAAEAICSGGGIESSDALDLLTHLVDKSIVTMESQDGEARYRLLETMRQYARDRLVEAGDAAEVRRRHCDWYLVLAEQAESELRGPRQISWLERLDTEHDNLRAALEWSLTEADGAEAGLRLASALYWFWYVHGDWHEGRGWLERVLERSHAAPASILPKALHGAAFLARRQGDYERVTPLVERGLALSRELGDKGYTAWFLVHYGLAALNAGGYDRAREFFEEALTLCRESGDKWFIATLGLHHVGLVARAQGKLEQAMTLYMEALAIWREVGDTAGIAYGLRLIGTLWLLQGEVDKAASSYAQVLAEPRWMGRREATESIEGLAQVASARGRHERAARLFGVAEALRETLGFRRLAMDQARHEEALASTRAKLGDADFETAQAEGRAMSLDEAIGYALAGPGAAGAQRPGVAPGATAKDAGPLTAREREVAVLVARGLTNREIAAKLVISERTADAHVQHILNKLGFGSRAQIAAWAVEQGLPAGTSDSDRTR